MHVSVRMSRREKWIAATLVVLLAAGGGIWAWYASHEPTKRFCTMEGLMLPDEEGAKYNPIRKNSDCVWVDRNGDPLPDRYQRSR
jgi:hypothetical protein